MWIGANQAASVVSAHALAMFVTSFITGKLIEKYGEKSIIASGDFILAGNHRHLPGHKYLELLCR